MSAEDDDKSRLPTPEEEREAEELRDALDRGEDALGVQLMAALRPRDLDEDIHERILARALGLSTADAPRAAPVHAAHDEVTAPAGEAERGDAARLRDALESPLRARDHQLAGLATALRSAHAPRVIDDVRNEALLRPALRQLQAPRRRSYGSVVGALAVAAAVLGLWFTSKSAAPPGGELGEAGPPHAPVGTGDGELTPGMVESRSTNAMFKAEDFPQEGGERDRIDRINRSRRADLRENRFLSWGVR